MRHGIYENGKIIAEFVVPMTLRSNQPVFLTDTLALQRVVRRRAAQRWELDTKLTPLGASANELMTLLVTRGHYASLTIITPQNLGAFNKNTALTLTQPTLSLASSAAAFSTTVSIAGVQGGAGKIVPQGTFIRFAGHTKVYMLTADLVLVGVTSPATAATANFFPALRKPVTAGSSVRYRDDVEMIVYFDSDVVTGMVYEDGVLMDTGTVKLVEALQTTGGGV
jgi:hypothetical protein